MRPRLMGAASRAATCGLIVAGVSANAYVRLYPMSVEHTYVLDLLRVSIDMGLRKVLRLKAENRLRG